MLTFKVKGSCQSACSSGARHMLIFKVEGNCSEAKLTHSTGGFTVKGNCSKAQLTCSTGGHCRASRALVLGSTPYTLPACPVAQKIMQLQLQPNSSVKTEAWAKLGQAKLNWCTHMFVY